MAEITGHIPKYQVVFETLRAEILNGRYTPARIFPSETIASIAAKAAGQAMAIVRYADDFVILAKEWAAGFLGRVEGILEGRMGLTVNREKTKVLDLEAEHSALTFLGYEFRKVRDRLYGTGMRYLHFGPSAKSVKRVCREVHELTHSRNVLLPVETVVERVNRLLKGWE